MIHIFGKTSALGLSVKIALAAVSVIGVIAPVQAGSQASPAPPSTTNAPPAPDDIVVTGELGRRATVSHEAKSFERDVQATPVGGQLARWHLPICPEVEGVDRLYGDMVASKMREIARSVGAAVGGNGCRPNVVVTFTPDAKGLIAAIERRQPRALSLQSASEREMLRRSSLPVRWWYTTLLEGANGEQFVNESTILSNQLQVPTNEHERYLATYSSSLIDTKFRASITDVAIVIDVPYATGHRLDAVAEYAAFVALGHIRVGSRPTAVASILGLFDAGATNSDTLTKWDTAYLNALYKISAGRSAETQRDRIAGDMVATIAK